MDYFDVFFFFCLEFGLLVLKSQTHYVIFSISLQLFVLSGKSIFFSPKQFNLKHLFCWLMFLYILSVRFDEACLTGDTGNWLIAKCYFGEFYYTYPIDT